VVERVRRERPAYSDLPVIKPDQRAAIPAAYADVERSLQGSTPEHIAAVLGTISCALPKRQTDADAQAMLEVYIRALADIPPDILEHAGMEAVKTCKFFPKVAELRELARPEMSMRKWRLFVLGQLAEKHDREWRDPVKHPMAKPEDIARLRRRIERQFTSRREAKA
jgi:hypothetical protein